MRVDSVVVGITAAGLLTGCGFLGAGGRAEYQASVVSVEPHGQSVSVTVSITNVGDGRGGLSCTIILAPAQGSGPRGSAIWNPGPVPAGQTRTVTQDVPVSGDPAAVTVEGSEITCL